MTFITHFIAFLITIIKSFFDTLRCSSRFACMVLVAFAAMFMSAVASAQTLTLRVDIANGSPNGDGSAWESDAIRFLQDALSDAEAWLSENEFGTVEIWVASAWDGNDPIPYRPDQSKANDTCGEGPADPGICCPPYGDCNNTESFKIPANVTLLGAFPPDPHDAIWGIGGATEEDRDPTNENYLTILSGDLEGDDEIEIMCEPTYAPAHLNLLFTKRSDNSKRIVEVMGNDVAIDGFTIRGSVCISGAGARLLDCTFIVAEGPALRCFGASNIQLWRCAFAIRSDDRAKNRTIDEFVFADDASDVFIINSRILRESTEALPVNMERLPRRLE